MHFYSAQCKQKGFALPLVLIGVLLLSLIGAGGYYIYSQQKSKQLPIEKVENKTFLSPSPSTFNKTANWKTYTNTKFNFQIEYPPTWFIENLPHNIGALDEAPTPVISGPAGCAPPDNRCGSFGFDIGDLKNSQFNGYTSKQYYDYFKVDPFRETVSENEISVGSDKAYEQVFRILNTTNKELHKQITFIHNNIAFRIDIFEGRANDGVSTDNFGIQSVNDWQNNEIFNQILATFKFLDDETANWKTYTNKKYGFSFKYPSENIITEQGQSFLLDFPPDTQGVFTPFFYVDIINQGENDIGYNNDEFTRHASDYLSVPIGSKVTPNGQPFNAEFIHTKDVLVDGILSRLFESNIYGDKRILVKKSELIFLIGGYYDNRNKESEAKFQKLLSSFKFLD